MFDQFSLTDNTKIDLACCTDLKKKASKIAIKLKQKIIILPVYDTVYDLPHRVSSFSPAVRLGH